MAALLECTALKGTGKQGVLTPNEDGYYTVVMGAYDIQNSVGAHYDLNSALGLLAPGSPLQRQIEKGVLYGELGHPNPQHFVDANGVFNRNAFFQRLYKIEEDRCAVHIRRVWVDRNFKDHQGRTVCAVMGEIRPQGMKSQMAAQALENPSSNFYMSVRSVTMDDQIRRVKYSKAIITWDFVIEGGIEVANKYDTPGLESFTQVQLTPDMFWAAKAALEHAGESLGMEAAQHSLEMLGEALNWSAPKPKNKAAWHNW